MTCEICNIFAGRADLVPFLTHLRQCHRHDRPFTISCIVHDCNGREQAFKSFESLYRHCLRIHMSSRWPSTASSETVTAEVTESEIEETITSHETTRADVPVSANEETSGNNNCQQWRNIQVSASPSPMPARTGVTLAHSIYQLKVNHSLPQVAISDLICGLASSLTELCLEVVSQVEKKTSRGTISFQTSKQAIHRIFSQCIRDVETAKTDYSQKKNLAPRLSYAVPKAVTLGRTFCFKGGPGKRRPSQTCHNMYYIPIADTLRSLEKDKSFQIMLANNQRYCPNSSVLSSCQDGEYIRQHPLSSQDNSLSLILYYDDVEICNPLGSYVKKHRLAMFYFTLTCVPPEYRSRLHSIFLLGIAYSNDVKRYGIDKVLQPFYDEIEMLATDRIVLNILGVPKSFKCYLLAISADTPAANLLCGFKEGVGFAYRKCRHCMAVSESMSHFTYEEEFQSRTREQHEQQISNWTTVDSGINRKSSLLNVPYFDMFTCVPHDVMHILFEGAIPCTVKLVLNHLIYVANVLSLEQLNYQISHFAYSKNDEDKPSPISQHQLSSSGMLRQSSSQMWCLFRLLPLMIHSYIDTDCAQWKCLMTLSEITSIIMSPSIPLSTIPYLKQAIAFYLTEFKMCFQDVPLTPKQHYLVHIPSHIVKLGPPVAYWCMRFEAKHHSFKKLVKNGMFKDVAKSLAMRHQLRLGAWCMKNHLFTSKLTHGASRPITNDIMKLMPGEGLFRVPMTKFCDFVKIDGTKFFCNSVILQVDEESMVPKFGIIKHILLKNSHEKNGITGIFLIQNLVCLGLEENLNSFVCEPSFPCTYELVNYSDLKYFGAISCYDFEGKLYIPQKVDFSILMHSTN